MRDERYVSRAYTGAVVCVSNRSLMRQSNKQPMSAIGPKRTCLVAPHMSAFGGKADMTIAVRNVRL
jgi:hypothetical protein